VREKSNVIPIERVRCLECGARYIKPFDGGTVHENPGCPRCSYVGWISVSIPNAKPGGLMPSGLMPGELCRFAGDRRLPPIAPAH
jgi:hypothetical protein